MPGQIKLITVDFSHRLQQLRPNLGTHFNGTCQLLATKSYQNTLPLIINMLKLQQTTEHLSGLWIFGFGLGFWLSTPLFFLARLCNLLDASWSCQLLVCVANLLPIQVQWFFYTQKKKNSSPKKSLNLVSKQRSRRWLRWVTINSY